MPTQPYLDAAGKRLPSVTGIIGTNLGWSKNALAWWAWDQGRNGLDFRKTKDAAAEAGTIAHAWAEDDIKGHPLREYRDADPDVLAKAESAFDSYLSWKRMTRIEIVSSEVALVSETLRYGGCLDAVGLIESVPCLIDFKTSNGTYGDHVIQVAAYARLWNDANPSLELTGGAHLLRFGKEHGDFHHSFIPAKALGSPWRAFEALLLIHGMKKQIESLA